MNRRRLPPEPVVLISPGDYLDQTSRLSYLRQKASAEARMTAFDNLPAPLRVLATAAQSIANASTLYRHGVRDFADAERAIARAAEPR